MPGARAEWGRRRTVWLYGGLVLFAAGVIVVAFAVNALRSDPGCDGGCAGSPSGEATTVGRADDSDPLVVLVPAHDDGSDTAAVISAAGGAVGAVLGGTAMLISVLRR
ncbi:hypothetical protein G3I76_11170, partial [Streptomyces sp. SID11233]|nr:hypothetical protein [Streptomyces sp. SID11233]